MNTGKQMEWRMAIACGGAVMFACLCTAPQADARRRRQQICQEWRDYYYNANTGEFLGWAGEPYWVCHYEDEPISFPDSPAPDHYGGGWGVPRDPDRQSCSRCKEEHQQCMNNVMRGSERCLSHYREQARAWCVRTRRKKFGRPLEGDYTCERIENPRGRPIMHCFGPAIEDCVESFAQNQPDRSIENTDRINVGHDWWGVGNDRTSTVTWGGSRGFVEGCRLAMNEAGAICLDRLNACEEAAGGCR